MSFASQLKKWDAYGKLSNDVKVKTFSGAAISLTAAAIIIILFLAELNHFLKVETHDELIMDAEAGAKLPIHFDITFFHLPCSILSIDAMDVSGDHQFDLSHHISKTTLSRTGEIIGGTVKHELLQKKANESTPETKKCGNCYGAEEHPGQCCNTCDDVRKAYRAKGWALDDLKNIEQCVTSGQTNEAFATDLAAGLGCRVYGLLEVNRVNGNFHFAPGKSFENAAVHVHDLMSFTAASFNISHRINHIRFGDSFPGARHPLDKFNVSVVDPGGMFMYYTKVVPTSYRYSNGKELSTNQFSATTHFRKNQENAPRDSHLGLPGVFFFYELSPVRVIVKETSQGFIHFVARVCAIVGGVFTIAGIIDKFVYHGVRVVEKKLQINKLS